MHVLTRITFWAALPLFFFVGMVGCASPAAPSPTVAAPANAPTVANAAPSGGLTALNVAFSAIAVPQLPLWVAYEQGLFKKNGLDVTLTYVSSNPAITAALLSGELQMAQLAEDGVITSGLQGGDLEILAPSSDHLILSLYGKPDLTSVEDLKGKKVGVSQRGSATDFAARWLLSQHGLQPDKDVTLVNIGSVPDILRAITSGAADAGVISPPTTFQAQKAGLKELVDFSTLNLPFYQSAVVARRSWVKDNADAVRRFVQAYVQAIAVIKKDKATAEQVLGKYSKTTDITVLDGSYNAFVKILPQAPIPRADAIQTGLDQAAVTNPNAKTADPNQFFDASWVTELDQNGFIASLYK
jgi:NitT/TauT family transport system substrate-binding protein